MNPNRPHCYLCGSTTATLVSVGAGTEHVSGYPWRCVPFCNPDDGDPATDRQERADRMQERER